MKPHASVGRKQSTEHVRKRVIAVALERATWSDEKKKLHAERIMVANALRAPEIKERFSKCNIGRTPWNKGNNWRLKIGVEAARKYDAEKARRHRQKESVKINNRMSTRIRQSLKGFKNRRSWESLVPYTIEELESHLRKTIPLGYDWSDFLIAKLEIDHIYPVSRFDIKTAHDEEFKKCWALSNLQLLPAFENNSKNNKVLVAKP